MAFDDKTSGNSLLTDEEMDNIKGPKEEKDDVIHPKADEQPGGLFTLELLICSMILWSFLFLMSNEGCKGIISQISQILSSDTQFAFLTSIEEELMKVIQEIL